MAGRTYKTANGVTVDIDQLRLLNERVVAVGNMQVNTRGDQVNSDGSIKTNRNEIMKKTYRTNAVIGGKIVDATQKSDNRKTSETHKTNTATVAATNPTNTQATVNAEQPTLRGSLAQAISNTAPTSETTSSDLLSTSTTTKTIKRI